MLPRLTALVRRSVEDGLPTVLMGDSAGGALALDLFIGDRDILRPAVDVLTERVQDARVDLHVHEVTSMLHVWMTRAIPEARRTRTQLVELVRRAG